MFLDASTLRDLEVLATTHPRGITLWSLVDRTRSRAGARALHQRLLTPPETGEEIVARQNAHRVLAADEAWPTRLTRADLDGVETYLGMTWQQPGSMPALAPVRWWYRQYLRDVARGQASVVALLSASADIAERFRTSDASLLQHHGEHLAAALDRLASLGLHASSRSRGRAFDRVARGEGAGLLREVVTSLAAAESMWSLGMATREHGWTYPTPSTQLRVIGLVHPALAAAAVPNDLVFEEAVRLCFLTGPNMAGKSTFMKAVAIAVVLAHAGCGVPAASMTFPVVGGVFTSIDVADDLAAGESFYLAEVRRVGALARVLRERGSAFALLDEPFRGTNVHDATEATLAVLTRLADHPGALVCVSSHLSELAPLLATHGGVSLWHFAADVASGDPRFDYRLRVGTSSQRLGMTLLQKERIIEMLDASVASAAGDSAMTPGRRGGPGEGRWHER